MSEIPWEPCLVEPRRDRDLERRIVRGGGLVSRDTRLLAPLPWLAEHSALLHAAVLSPTHLDAPLADLVALVVGRDLSSRYGFAVQRARMRLSGSPESRIRAVERDFESADLTPREHAAVKFSHTLSRADPLVSAHDLRALTTAGFDERTQRELIGLVALHVYHGQLSTLLAFSPERHERLPDRWYARGLGPLAGPLLAPRLRRPMPASELSAAGCSGPYADAVQLTNGSPSARPLRGFLDACFESSLLSPRARGLIFSVVARTLGCTRSQAEARRLLTEHGTPEHLIDEVITHHSASGLDSMERVVLPFAHETVRIRPDAAQRRAREIRDALPRAVFLDLIGTLSIANAICRIGGAANGMPPASESPTATESAPGKS